MATTTTMTTPAISDALLKLSPDVVALQEVDINSSPGCLDALVEELGPTFNYAFFGHVAGVWPHSRAYMRVWCKPLAYLAVYAHAHAHAHAHARPCPRARPRPRPRAGRYGNALISKYPIVRSRGTHLRGGTELSFPVGMKKLNGEIAKEVL